MRVLLDTNVLIAAFISRGTCHELLEHVAHNHQIVSSKYILDELRDRLRNKFRYSEAEVRDAVRLIADISELVTPVDLEIPAVSDTEDLPILGTAIAGACRCIVTGDKDLQELGQVEGIPILSPSGFWQFEDLEL